MKTLLKSIIVLFFIWFFLGFLGSWVSTHPRLVALEAPEHYWGKNYQVEEITLQSSDHKKIATWFVDNNQSTTVVILLAGIGGNRVGMIERAKIYLDQGFGVLLADLRGTGESDEGIISFGWGERLDLMALVDFLQQRNIQNIGVHGCSLGAATISYTLPEQPPYQFVVMEAPYDNVTQAFVNRLDLMGLPLWPFQPIIWWTEWRIGVDADLLAPEDYVALYEGPILLVAGDVEQKVKKEETEKIFSKMTSKEKKLYFFAGHKHEDYQRKDPDQYRAVLSSWIEKFAPRKVTPQTPLELSQ